MTMKACKQLYPFLAAYAGGELTPSRHAQVAAHVHGCERCADCVSTIMPVVQTLAAESTLPRWQASPAFRERLDLAIHAEIAQRTHPRRLSLWRALLARPLATTGLAGATVALALTLVLFIPSRPTADTLDDAIKAIQRCDTVHVTGYTNLSGFVDEKHRLLNPPRVDPLEIWWSKDGHAWMRAGDRVLVRNGSQWRLRSSFKGAQKTPTGTGPFAAHLNELASPENYLRKLRGLARDRETRPTSVRRGGVLKLTIVAGDRQEMIEVDAHTKRLRRAETTIVMRDLAGRRQLDHFTYDQPIPSHVLNDMNSVLQPQDQSIR